MNFSGEFVKIKGDPLFSEQKRLKKSNLIDKVEKRKCDYVATKSSHLKTHIRSKHEGVRYPCSHCEFAATQEGVLKRHIENKHKGVSNHVTNVITLQLQQEV